MTQGGRSSLARDQTVKRLLVAAFLLALVAGCQEERGPELEGTWPGEIDADSALIEAMDPRSRSEVVEAIAERLIEGYIYEDAGLRIAEGVRAMLAEGRYDATSRPADFARALTEDLQALSDDVHLRVRYMRSRPETESERPSRAATAHESPVPEPGPTEIEPHPESLSGLGRVERLAGGVAYIELVHFGGGEESSAEIDAEMADAADARALILDLRRNLGGGPFMVRYVSTYLFDRPTHLASRIERGRPDPAERWTFESVPGERLAHLPVVLLTSKTTISAAESFAFGLRNTDRAVLVGERTAGGGHFGEMVDLTNDFHMFLPRGKTVHPTTGEGWEAEGLEPDIEVPADEALDAALEYLGRDGVPGR